MTKTQARVIVQAHKSKLKARRQAARNTIKSIEADLSQIEREQRPHERALAKLEKEYDHKLDRLQKAEEQYYELYDDDPIIDTLREGARKPSRRRNATDSQHST
jgi:chromosome segregation ATPase